MLSLILAFAAGFDLECTYPSRAKGIATAKHCAARGKDGELRIDPARLRDLAFDPKTGTAPIHVGGWYLVRRDGTSAPVMAFDNGAEEFAEGLARSPRGSGIGYVDSRLELVIAARYDGAYRFRDGRAAVCFGCVPLSDGEHGYYGGGSWACIDRTGREIRPRFQAAPRQAAVEVCG